MASNSPPTMFFIFFLLLFSAFPLSLGHKMIDSDGSDQVAVGRRVLLSFKETPSGGNNTFECSPSGPCVPCLSSEKKGEEYRCSETGYRIPFNCLEVGVGSSETNSKNPRKSRATLEVIHDKSKLNVMLHEAEELTISTKHRRLLDDLSTSKGGTQSYITYRSCMPPISEEKLSVLGFEGIVLGMLFISSSIVYFRRKRSGGTASGVVGAMWSPINNRF